MDEIFGLGPLEELLRDPTITDILVNGSSEIYIERRGRLEPTDVRFRDEAHLHADHPAHRRAGSAGASTRASPMLDARLADGSRVNAIIPPLPWTARR